MGTSSLRDILDDVLARDVNAINLQHLPAHAGFAVGESVHVSARMGPTFNKPGGAATVLSKRISGSSGEVLYSVSYPINGGRESDLPAALLSAPAETPRRRLSSSSSPSSAASSDSRRVASREHELERRKDDLEKQLGAERWQANQLRREAAAVREKMGELLKELSAGAAMMKKTAAYAAKLELQNEACREEMHKNLDEITATAAAADDESTKMATKVKALQSSLRREEKARKVAEGAVEEARNKEEAKTARILANVQILLDESKQAAEAEFEEEREQHAAKVAGLQGELQESAKPATSLVSLAAKAGFSTEKRLSATTGARASSFETMGPRDQAAATRAAAAAIQKTLEFASPLNDPADSAPFVFGHVQLRALVASGGNGAGVNAELLRLRELQQNVATAVRIYAERKEQKNVRQLLSLFPRSFPAGEVAAACSSPKKTMFPGDLVRVESAVPNQGAAVMFARVEATGEETAMVVFLERSNEEKRQRFATSSQALSAVAATVADGKKEEVLLQRLRHASDVHITKFQVYEALKLAATQFPGAYPTQSSLTRVTKSVTGVLELVKHLMTEELFVLAEASRRNAERGLKYLRTMSISKSYALLKEQCTKVGVPTIRWPDYLDIVSTREYDNLTLLNCVCTLCRVLIYEAKDEFLLLLSLVLAPQEMAKALAKRIDQHTRSSKN